MFTRSFASFEAHAAAVAIGNAELRTTLLAKACSPWAMTSLKLPAVSAQWGHAAAANVIEGTVIPGGISLYMPTRNARVVRVNGCRFDAQTVRLQVPGDEFRLSSLDAHDWFTLFVPYALLATWEGADAACFAPSSRFIRLPVERALAIRRVVEQLRSIAVEDPRALESSVAIDTTSHKLAEAVREALWDKPAAADQHGRQPVPRGQVIDTAMEALEQRDREPLTVTQLASIAHISERTLRTVFQDHFGMGPVRYLRLRTLNLVRDALHGADASATTVTQVATEFGVWELGRLAHDYQLLFGELPSETLCHARRTRISTRRLPVHASPT
jgi:AraC family ethanolamine operon transcriptional activator